MKKNPRVLFDLWVSMVGGYAGIPQDARTVFSMLSQCDNIDVSGLFYLSRCILPRNPISKKVDICFDAIIQEHLPPQIQLSPPILKKILRRLRRYSLFDRWIQGYNLASQNKFAIQPVGENAYEFIWNTLSKTLDDNLKNSVLGKNYYYSDISFRDMQFSAYYNRSKCLDTKEFDFVVFPDVRAVKVSPQTKKIIRYHDSFGFLCPDFFQTNHSQFHLNSLKACAKDSYFVCNSEHTKDDLIAVFPELETKTTVIPPLVKPYPKKLDWQKLKEICLNRISNKVYMPGNNFLMSLIFEKEPTFDYILGLSTLEPRKNYINLILAWEKYNSVYQQKTKLIIVANKGWLSEEIEKLMLPHIEKGDMIHLSGVPSEEIPYLFSHAKCFAYLSFIEGFGSPPLEGMLCECPVLASDNPTHRWTMGDAALYVDPYDVDAISDGLAQLLIKPGHEPLRKELANKGLEQVKKYNAANIKEQWSALFEKLSS